MLQCFNAYIVNNPTIVVPVNGSCRFRPMASSPPHRLNLIEFAPSQIESHIEIIPRSLIHCLPLSEYWWRENFAWWRGDFAWWRDDR